MRPALLLAAALAGAALLPAAANAADPAPAAAPPSLTDADRTALDIRCLVVGVVLAQSNDQTLQNLGRASLFYFLGRLEGRGATDDLAKRVADVAHAMSADEVSADAKTCGAMFDASAQTLQDMSDTYQRLYGVPQPNPPSTPPH